MGIVTNFADWIRGRRTAEPEERAEDGATTSAEQGDTSLDPVSAHYARFKAEGRRAGLAGSLIEDEGRQQRLAQGTTSAAAAVKQSAWDPARHEGDRALEAKAEYLQRRLAWLRTAHDSTDSLRRDLVLKMPADVAAPRRPWGFMVLAAAVSAWGFSSSIVPSFFDLIGDPVLAWGAATAFGGALGGFLTLALFRD